MVKKLLVLLFLQAFLLGASINIKNAQTSINALSQTEINLTQVALSSIFSDNGGLKLAQIEEILGARLDRALLNRAGFEIKFISQSSSHALLFVKALKNALLMLSSQSEVSFIGRQPLEYSVKFERFSDTLAALDDALRAQGFRVSLIERNDFGIRIVLDDSDIRLNLAKIEPEKSVTLLGTSEFLLVGDVGALELSSRGARQWTAEIGVYDAKLNELAYAKKDLDAKILRLELPASSVYAVVFNERGASKGAMMLKAFSRNDKGE
ncbi:hypothetical protein [Campylobacter sp. 19-13652]|uniref:hypothetical protein n=1 Tax=Campylobacter sp. 19-13652 TaxID=2840180 RepID=UPI001C770782|nr:hypothetical protein [Campylobacter sp. 19-13652]BCX80113.1 hypothetical protein LBC_15750 [Campylobacter sp. 19-13652]